MTRTRREVIKGAAAVAGSALFAPAGFAQQFPSRNIRVIVPFPAGATTAAAVKHPDVQKRMTDVGAEPSGSTQAEMRDMLRKQVAQVRPVVEELKLVME